MGERLYTKGVLLKNHKNFNYLNLKNKLVWCQNTWHGLFVSGALP